MMDLAFMQACFGFQARAFFGEPLLDDILDRRADLHEVGGRHRFRFERLSAHKIPSGPECADLTRLVEVSLPVKRLKENRESSNGDIPEGTGEIGG